jgi:hypothetical protein
VAKLLLLLQSKNVEALEEQLSERLTVQLSTEFAAEGHTTVQLMRAVDNDVFYDSSSPFQRPQLIAEIITAPGLPIVNHAAHIQTLLEGLSCEASSLVFLMQERVYIDCAPQPIHYHYLMLKRPEFCVADYNDYYSNFHSRMGLHTPAITGYSQNYIDQSASTALASKLGLSCREVTSISELKMPSLEGFLASPAMADLGQPAAEDEARFVDRQNSVAFCSKVVLRLGDFSTIREAVHPQYFSD